MAAVAAESAAFAITNRVLGPAIPDATLSISYPILISNPASTIDFGGTVSQPTAGAAGAGQLVATFTIAPQSSATKSSYVIGASAISAITTVPAGGNCFLDTKAEAPISATFTLTRLPSCSYVLSPTDLSGVPAAGGAGNITVSVAGGCPVPAGSYQPWVTVEAVVPSGDTTAVSLTISPNSGAARATSILVADRLYLVTQQGGP
jgi:hypothetical protein